MVYHLSLVPRVYLGKRLGRVMLDSCLMDFYLEWKGLLGFSPSCERVSQDISGVLLCVVSLLVILIILLLHIYVTGSVYVSADDKMVMKV